MASLSPLLWLSLLAAFSNVLFVNAWSIADGGWIRVAHSAAVPGRAARSVLVDEHGREMLFRGINLNLQQWRPAGEDRPIDPAVYEQGRCPPNDPKHYKNPPLCGRDAGKGKFQQSTAPNSGNDLAQVRAMGFDIVRLGISWSFLEPTPGNYSDQYLDRVAQVVTWAKEQDIRVILDMHQDFYSFSLDNGSGIGGYVDGAPTWAVPNKSIAQYPWLERQLFDGVGYDWHTVAAFKSFYRNEKMPTAIWGLQEHYIRTVAQVAKRFKDEVAVLGIEILNEPPPSVINVFDWPDDDLYPFYRRVVQAITGFDDGRPTCPDDKPIGEFCAFPDLNVHDTKHIIFVEPMALRNQLDRDLGSNLRPFSSYDNIVFCPHTYSYSFTISLHLPWKLIDKSYAQALDTAWQSASLLHASVLVTEMGSPTDHLERLQHIVEQQDAHLTGSTFWTWKESGGGWGLWQGDEGTPEMQLQPVREKILSRNRPLAVSGQLTGLTFDIDTGRMAMSAIAPAGIPTKDAQPTLVYLHPRWAANVSLDSDQVKAVGSSIKAIHRDPDGSAILELWPDTPYKTGAHPTGSAYSLVVEPNGRPDHPKTSVVIV